MAEICARREYKCKLLHISHEIPKNPPTRTYWGSNLINVPYNRHGRRQKNEKGSGKTNQQNRSNTVQPRQSFKSQEKTYLKAEFRNSYKKYYRRVDVKKVEVQSTLNVDANYITGNKGTVGEGSKLKLKECMEINVIEDTKLGSPVNRRLQRTVEGIPPAERKKKGVWLKEADLHNEMVVKEYCTDNQKNQTDSKYAEPGHKPGMLEEPKQIQPCIDKVTDHRTGPMLNIKAHASSNCENKLQNRFEKKRIEDYMTDSAENCSDTLESLNIAGRYCPADSWKYPQTTLKYENKENNDVIGYKKSPTSSQNARTAGQSHEDNRSKSNSERNKWNMPSFTKLLSPYDAQLTAEDSYGTEISEKENNYFKDLELPHIQDCKKEEMLVMTKEKDLKNSVGKNYTCKYGIKIHRCPEIETTISSTQLFLSRIGSNSNYLNMSSSENSRSHCNITNRLDALENHNFEEHRLPTTAKENKTKQSCISRTEQIHEPRDRKITEELDNHILLSNEHCEIQDSSDNSILCGKGVFAELNQNFLKSIVINVSYPDSVRNVKLLDCINSVITETKRDNSNERLCGSGDRRDCDVSKKTCDFMTTERKHDDSEVLSNTNKFTNSKERDGFGCVSIVKHVQGSGEPHANHNPMENHSNVNIFDCPFTCPSRQFSQAFANGRKNNSKPIELTHNSKISELSNNDTDLHSDCVTYSTLQPSSDWNILCSRNHSNETTPDDCVDNSVSSKMFENPYSEEYTSEIQYTKNNNETTKGRGIQQCEKKPNVKGKHRYSNHSTFKRLIENEKKCRNNSSPINPGHYKSAEVLRRSDSITISNFQATKVTEDHSLLNQKQGCPQQSTIVSNENKSDIRALRHNKSCEDGKVENGHEVGSGDLLNGTKMQFGNNPVKATACRTSQRKPFSQLRNAYSKPNSRNEPSEIHLINDGYQINVDEAIKSCSNKCAAKNPLNQQLKDKPFQPNTRNGNALRHASLNVLQVEPTYSFDYIPKIQPNSKNQYQKKYENNYTYKCIDERTWIGTGCDHKDTHATDCRRDGSDTEYFNWEESSAKCCFNQEMPGYQQRHKQEGNFCGLYVPSNNHNSNCRESCMRVRHHQKRRTGGESRLFNDGESRFQCETFCFRCQQRQCISISRRGEKENWHSYNPCSESKFHCNEIYPNTETSDNGLGSSCRNNEQYCAKIAGRRRESVCLMNDKKEKCLCSHPDNDEQAKLPTFISDNERQWTQKKNITNSRNRDFCPVDDLFSQRTEQSTNNGQKVMTMKEENKNTCLSKGGKSHILCHNNIHHCEEEYNGNGRRRNESTVDNSRKGGISYCDAIPNSYDSIAHSKEYFSNVQRLRAEICNRNNKCLINFENTNISPASGNMQDFIFQPQQNKTSSNKDYFLKENSQKCPTQSGSKPDCYRKEEKAVWQHTKGELSNKKREDFIRSEHCLTEQRFPYEEQLESGYGHGIESSRRGILSLEEPFVNEPSYLREENWENGDQGTDECIMFPTKRNGKNDSFPSTNDICSNRKIQSTGADKTRRNMNISREEQSSLVFEVNDPCYNFEEQLKRNDEKCAKVRGRSSLASRTWQTTGRSGNRIGRGRWIFNPRRWDMVTELPQNYYSGRNFRPNDVEDDASHEDLGVGSIVFNNRRYE